MYIEAKTDVANNYMLFCQDNNILLDSCVPIKRRTKNELKFKLKPWLKERIKKMMRIRDNIAKELKRNRSVENLKLNREFKNRVPVQIKSSKLDYFHDYFSSNGLNMKSSGKA